MPADDDSRLREWMRDLCRRLEEDGEPVSENDIKALMEEWRSFEAVLTPTVQDAPAMVFTFDDLTRIDGAGIQVLVKALPQEVLALALVGAGDTVTDHILRNVASRRARMVREEMGALASSSLGLVEDTRKRIVKEAIALAAVGMLVISEE